MAAPAGTFLMNCWYVAAWDYELIDGKLLERTLLEQPVVLYKGDSDRPETRRSTHFFWDYLHDYDLQDATIAQSLNNSLVEGFMEDKFIIEAQQEVLDADPDFKMNGIVAA